MANGIIGTGLSGLRAAQAGLATASHNIANAATPGFSRQQAVQGTAIPQFTGSGYLGRGTETITVRRIFSDFLAGQANAAQAGAAQLETYYREITQIDNLLADPAAGLAPALDDFFRGVDALAADPAHASARQAVLSAAQALAGRFQGLHARLDAVRDGVNRQIESNVAEINAYAQKIAGLNQRIALAIGAAGGFEHLPNDLLDQRDLLVAELNELVGTSVAKQSDGSYNVFIGNGQALVVGTDAYALTALQSPDDPNQVAVGLVAGAATVLLPGQILRGGALGGLLEFRTGALDLAQNSLGRLAIGLAAAVNAQHRLGQDRNGQLGGDLFAAGTAQAIASSANTGTAVLDASIVDYRQLTTSDYRLQYDGANYTLTRLVDGGVQTFAALPQTTDGFTLSLASGAPAAGDAFLIQPTRIGARDFGVLVTDTARVAAAGPVRANTALANTGAAAIGAPSADPPAPAPALQHTVRLSFSDPGTFDVFDVTAGVSLAVGVAYTSGAPIAYNGWTTTITGTAAAGDQFTVEANVGGIGDNRNALALGLLQSTALLASGTETFVGAYATAVSDIGNRTRAAEIAQSAQATMLADIERQRESISGVNLDEEAAALVRYQQAYQAAGKTIAVAQAMFDTVLDILR